MNISLKNVSFGYKAGEELLDEVSITIGQKDKVAIIGENGTGKSTLMKLMAGLLEPLEGKVISEKWVESAYIAQEFNPKNEEISAEEYLISNCHEPDKALAIMDKLGFSQGRENQHELPMKQLSGGQKRMVDIASTFANSPTFVFIDEPENHLDIVARDLLISMMSSYWGAVMFVSHDQYLVDKVAKSIIEIEDCNLRKVSNMSYSDGQDSRQRQLDRDMDRWKVLEKKIRQKRDSVAILQRQARMNGKNAPKYHAAKRSLEKMEEELENTKPELDRKTPKIRIHDVEQKKRKMIFHTENLSYSFPDEPEKPLFSNINVNMTFGKRIALVGRNGTGKSTLFKLLLGGLVPTKGTARVGVNISIRQFTQGHESLLSGNSALQHCYSENMSEQKARSFLANLQFSQTEAEKPVEMLSGGQKSRLRFALMFASAPELLVLDEPTNNLDPTTWNLLVEWVNDYRGSVIVVSHDRTFLESIKIDNYWVIHGKKVHESLDTLDKIIQEIR